MATAEPDASAIIIAAERAALERWSRGDPDGFLEISAGEVSYFDPFVEDRIDGHDGLQSLYDSFRGKIHIERFDMIAPRVQFAGDLAVLTYRFDSHGTEGSMRWNTTEVYRKQPEGWRIIHTHWAFHQPKLAA
jgi:ketosteroid isomerase-like protein